jgi:hypothetical protein
MLPAQGMPIFQHLFHLHIVLGRDGALDTLLSKDPSGFSSLVRTLPKTKAKIPMSRFVCGKEENSRFIIPYPISGIASSMPSSTSMILLSRLKARSIRRKTPERPWQSVIHPDHSDSKNCTTRVRGLC